MNAQEIIILVAIAAGTALLITAGCIAATVHNTRMRIRNGYPLTGPWGQAIKPELTSEAMERVRLLSQENAALRAELSSVKDRMAVMERIVTDKGFDLANQIERLRDRPEPQPRIEAPDDSSVN